MATGPGRYDGVRELRSRLPDVPDTVIAYFLSKYNVDECYERLKNGYDETSMSSMSEELVYNSQIFGGGDMTAPDGATTPGWGQAEMSPSLFHEASWEPERPQCPYPEEPYEPSRSVATTGPDAELLLDQRRQLECIRKIRDAYMQDLTALRADTEKKRDTLTALRIKVSEGPTILDTASLQDIISTLLYDIQTMQNKIQVEKTQAEMKQKLDVYTEEGVRWNCQKCGFLNHPLMSRCESCDQTR